MVWSRTEKRRGRCGEKDDEHVGVGGEEDRRPGGRIVWRQIYEKNNWMLGWCIIGMTGDNSSKTATPYYKWLIS